MRIIAIIVLLTLCGCSETVWIERRVPITDEHRKSIVGHVESVTKCLPQSISGDDQDLEYVINAAYDGGTRAICPITYWEYHANGFPEGGGEFTGKWRYAMPPAP